MGEMKILKVATEKLKAIKKPKKNENDPKPKPNLNSKKPEKSEAPQIFELEISAKTVAKVMIILGIFWAAAGILVQLKSVLVIASVSFFVAMGLSPILDSLEKFRIPRPIAILILYAFFLGGLGVLFVKIIPILSEQLNDIALDLREFVANGAFKAGFVAEALRPFEFDPVKIQSFLTQNIGEISKNLQSVAGSTFSILSGVFQGVFNFIFALVLIFFILLEREKIGAFVLSLFPRKNQNYIKTKTHLVQQKMAEWFRGQIILMISMGTFIYLGMKIFEYFFGMKYAATIGLLAAFMELFPYIGPVITGLLAVLVAINISWILVVAVLGWIAIAQFLEGNVLIPVVMEKVVGLSSVAVMLALATGGILGNAVGGVPLAILGMILAVPIAASISIFVQDYASREA